MVPFANGYNSLKCNLHLLDKQVEKDILNLAQVEVEKLEQIINKLFLSEQEFKSRILSPREKSYVVFEYTYILASDIRVLYISKTLTS